MPTISDVSIINWNTAKAEAVASGLERILCSEELCGSKTLDVYQRTVQDGRQFDVKAGDDYHLVYVIEAPKPGVISFNGKSHAADEGAGVLLVPGESARFGATGAKLELLHMVTPKPPAAVEGGLPGGPGYFFNRKTLRPLSDASGGRVRRFCAESTVRLLDGERLTLTNAIQAGEMHYHEGGRRLIIGTSAPPPIPAAHPTPTSFSRAAAWSRSAIPVRKSNPARWFIFLPAYRIGSALTAVRSTISNSRRGGVSRPTCSARPLGLKWYYDPVTPGAARVEWDQS